MSFFVRVRIRGPQSSNISLYSVRTGMHFARQQLKCLTVQSSNHQKDSNGIARYDSAVGNGCWCTRLVPVSTITCFPPEVSAKLDVKHEVAGYLGITTNQRIWITVIFFECTLTFCISSLIASIHNVFPSSLSISIASCMVLGIVHRTCGYGTSILNWPFLNAFTLFDHKWHPPDKCRLIFQYLSVDGILCKIHGVRLF